MSDEPKPGFWPSRDDGLRLAVCIAAVVTYTFAADPLRGLLARWGVPGDFLRTALAILILVACLVVLDRFIVAPLTRGRPPAP